MSYTQPDPDFVFIGDQFEEFGEWEDFEFDPFEDDDDEDCD